MLTYLLWTKLIKLVLLPLQPYKFSDPDNQSGYAIVIARSDTFKKVLFMPYNRHRIYSRNMMGETTRWGSWYDATKGVVIPGSNPVV